MDKIVTKDDVLLESPDDEDWKDAYMEFLDGAGNRHCKLDVLVDDEKLTAALKGTGKGRTGGCELVTRPDKKYRITGDVFLNKSDVGEAKERLAGLLNERKWEDAGKINSIRIYFLLLTRNFKISLEENPKILWIDTFEPRRVLYKHLAGECTEGKGIDTSAMEKITELAEKFNTNYIIAGEIICRYTQKILRECGFGEATDRMFVKKL